MTGELAGGVSPPGERMRKCRVRIRMVRLIVEEQVAGSAGGSLSKLSQLSVMAEVKRNETHPVQSRSWVADLHSH